MLEEHATHLDMSKQQFEKLLIKEEKKARKRRKFGSKKASQEEPNMETPPEPTPAQNRSQ